MRVNPAELRALPGLRLRLAGHTFGWSFSPDRSKLALGSDGSSEVRVIDLRRWRVLGDIEVKLAPRGSVIASAWAGANRLLAVIVSPGCCGLGDTTVAGIDARRTRVLWQRRLSGSLQAGARFRRSLALVLGPRGRSVGPSRLVLVRPDGRTRSALLTQIRSGLHSSATQNRSRLVTEIWNPGLAVDPSGARAFVVQAGAPIAEVDLRTLRVRYHTLSQSISLLGRLRDWLEPKAAAKAEDGPTRKTLWLGHGLLAVTGFDSHAGVNSRGRQFESQTPAGLKLIDTRRWSVRTLDSRTTDAALTSGTLLGWSLLWDSRTSKLTGNGLTGYQPDGSRRFHLYGNDAISGVEALGSRVLVGGAAGSRLFRRGALLDARSGRQLGRLTFDFQLLAGDQPFWY